MHRHARFVLAAFTGIALALASVPAGAASSIRIKVDDQPITSYDIAQRTTLLRLTGVGGEKDAIEELIAETLQFIEAAKKGVSISEGRVDLAIADISSRTKMTPAQLEKALASQGVNIDTLRRRIKAQMTWQQLVQMRMRFEGAAVKGSDITAAMFDEAKDGEFKTTEYILQQIVFVVPAGSSNAFKTQRRREAEGFRSRFPGCEQSIAMAKQLKGVVVKPLGRRMAEELTGPEGQEIRETPVGKASRPIPTDAGYDLVAVCSKKTLDSNAAARSEAENKLMLEQNKDLGKDYLAELREKAVIEYR